MSILGFVFLLLALVFSITIHEAMHAFTSYWLGDDTAKDEGRLSLNPIKHIDPIFTILVPILMYISGGPVFGAAKPVPFNPRNVKYDEWGAAMVAIAGPLTNLVLAFLSYAVLFFTGNRTSLVSDFFVIMLNVNVGFFIFNILPLPPLDGSRVLYALAPEFVRRGMESMESIGVFAVFGLILIDFAAFQGKILGSVMMGGYDLIIQMFQMFFGLF